MDNSLYGEIPNHSVVYAACDSKYFIDHGASFVYSVNDIGKNVHVHVCNPTQEVLTRYAVLNSDTDVKFTMTFNDRDSPEKLKNDSLRTYYACLRFFYLPLILSHANQVMTLDIDCVLMKDFDWPSTPIGYFPRQPLPGTVGWEKQGTSVAAGVLFTNSDAMDASIAISQRIQKGPFKWFLDQIALSETINRIHPKYLTRYDGEFMDWEFKQGTTIWTGKGSRKHDNLTYLQAKKKFDRYVGASTRVWA